MTIALEFAKSVGGKLAHVTAKSNIDNIRRTGLRSAAELARLTGLEPSSICLRKTRQQVGPARLNHQLPILHGLNAAKQVLDGYTPESWAAQLDERIFFWPAAKGRAFERSVSRDVQTETVWLNARAFAEMFLDQIDLCALNSGNFTQGGAHARRGSWVYRPLTDGLPAFRQDRKNRGLVSGSDTIKEVSLRVPISADQLRTLYN